MRDYERNMIDMQYEVSQFEHIQYVTRYPNGYEPGKKYPVIMFFHGAGGRGKDVNVLMNNPYFKITDEYTDFSFITVAPLCSTNTWFDMFPTLERLVVKTANEEFADKTRIYAMGASMGGYATWQIAMSMPEIFAAIVPICGGGMYWNAARLVNVPAWAFHGKKDASVFVEESEKMVNAVNKRGGNAKLTIYPENEHNAWSDTYSNPEVFDWLLTNENSNAAELIDIYNDSKLFG